MSRREPVSWPARPPPWPQRASRSDLLVDRLAHESNFGVPVTPRVMLAALLPTEQPGGLGSVDRGDKGHMKELDDVVYDGGSVKWRVKSAIESSEFVDCLLILLL